MVRNIALMKNDNTGTWIFLETMYFFYLYFVGFPYICFWMRLIKISPVLHGFPRDGQTGQESDSMKRLLLFSSWGSSLGEWDLGNQGRY